MDDFRENFAKIIESKTKQIKLQSEKYDTKIRLEIKKVISLQEEIISISSNNNLTDEDKQKEIQRVEEEIKSSRIEIKQLTKEKKEALGSDSNIEFMDDHRFKTDYEL